MKKTIRRILNFIKIFYPRNIHKILVYIYSITLISNRTNELIEVIGAKGYTTYLEVGVWEGDNLIPIANKFPLLICYGVDPYSGSSFTKYYKGEIMALVNSEYYENMYKNIESKTNKYKNINILRKTSEEAAKDFLDESLDIVFIDARHDYDSVVKDIELWLPKVRVGGVLSGHDYSLTFFGVVEAVNHLIGYDNVSIKPDATWIYFKR